MRLAPLLLGGILAACAPTAPRSVSGTLPLSGSYALLATETVSPGAQKTLTQALASRGLVPAAEGQRPDRLVSLTLADRPVRSGSFAGETAPVSRKADGWMDRPLKARFGRNRREVRLTIRFLSRDGTLREQRTATEVVRQKASAPDLSALIEAALAS